MKRLPPEFQARLHAVPGTRFRLTAELIEENDAERLAALRADLQAGLDELRAGLGEPLDAQDFLDEMHREHGA